MRTRILWSRHLRAGFSAWTLGLLLAPFITARSGDWPHYRGPNHDGISAEIIRTNWSETPPRELWRVPLPNGFSSITVSQGRAFTLYADGGSGTTTEVCLALDADTGEQLWATPIGQVPSYGGTGVSDAPNGPRSTPVVDGDRVYTYSAYMSLVCLAADTGRVLWTNDLVAAYGAQNIGWENAASPLATGDLVLVNSGATAQSLMAFNTSDGTLAWKGQTERITHASPVTATIHGVEQTIFYTQAGLVSVAPASGDVLWRHPVNYNGTSVGASPVVAGNRVYCSRAYAGTLQSAKAGALVVELGFAEDTFNVTSLWFKTNQFMNHWSTPVQRDGYVYGLYGQWSTGTLKCLDLATGSEQWSGPNFASGGVLLVGDHLLVLADNGELILAQADPTQYLEIDRFKPLGRRCWNAPAVSNGRIYARSTFEIVGLDVAAVAPLSIATGTLASGTVGQAYSTQLTAAGGVPPYGWTLAPESDPLPAGLDLSSEGLLGGTPAEPGTFNLVLQVTDAQPATASAALSLAIAPPPLEILTDALPEGTVGIEYAVQLSAQGGVPPYAWVVSPESGSLPQGLMLEETGLISGIPAASGVFEFALEVVDGAEQRSAHTFQLEVLSLRIALEVPPQDAEDIARDGFVFSVSANAPGNYVVEWTTDFASWREFANLSYANTPIPVTDPEAGGAQARFYRIRRVQ